MRVPFSPASPAFPFVLQIGAGEETPAGVPADGPQRYIYYGMSTRAYFAAHAPAEPQLWFEPVMTARPALEWDHEHSLCGTEFSSRMPWDCIPSNKPALDAWLAERDRQRYIQWPWAWANAVLAAGGDL